MNAKIFIAIVAAVVLLSAAAVGVSEETDAATYNYSLSFDANGGTDAPGGLTYGPTSETSHIFTIPDSEPTRSNYVFMGWWTDPNGDEIDLFYQPGDSITVTYSPNTVTLYAQWVDSGATSSFTVTIIAGGMVLPTSISMTGPGSVEPGTIGQIYANIIPTNAVNRGVIWTVTEGGNLITYTTDSTFRGGVLEFTARYAGTVTVTATSTADNSIVGTYTLTILAGTVDEDNQTVSLGGITGMLSGLFDGNTDIAGIVIYAIILMIIFLLIREPLPVLVISIPMTLIFTALGIVGTDFMILLIIIATLGLALIARNMWRD